MVRQLIKHKGYIIIIFVLIVIEPTINSILNFWVQRLFNAASPNVDKYLLLRLLTIGFLLWMFKRVVCFSAGVLKTRFICDAKQDIKHRLFCNLLDLNTSNISDIASSGEYISIFTNDISMLETRFYNQIIGLISDTFSILILGSSFLALNVKLASAILIFGIISMCVPSVFSKKLNEKNLIYSTKISRFTQKMKEYMVAYPTIKNYSIEQAIEEKFDFINQETEDTKFIADYALTLANNVGQLLAWFMQFIGVGLGLMLVQKGEILVGTVIAAQSFANDLASPLQNIIVNINSIRSVKEIVHKFEKLSIINKKECQKQVSGKMDYGDEEKNSFAYDECEIVFEKVSLQIGTKRILNDFSFTFESGKKYLIVGLNGSGKSSLFKLLKKWYDEYLGKISINGCNIDNLKSQDISKVVSYLNENVSIFSGTVKENISLFRKHNSEALEKAITEAQINLELDKKIMDEGRNISSGELRRIEIARSLLETVKVLIFDEVVSTLDIETAYEIEKMALDFDNKTVIFISHNFSGKLIHDYDEILVMENGSLLAHGKYDQLIENCEYFKQICEIKFGI